MGTTIPFAFSVHHFISSVGADAGFAAIIGLAILVLLYFAQARETANLRDRAEDAAAHLEELENPAGSAVPWWRGLGHGDYPPDPRSAGACPPGRGRRPGDCRGQNRQRRPVAARTAAPQAVPTVQAGAPAAPAGVGAPALSAATRLIPDPEREAVAFHANGAPASGAAAVLTPSPPPPSTAAGGANGSSGPGAGAGGSGSAPVGATTVGAGPIARPPARPAGRAAPPPRRPGAAAPGRAGAPGGGSRISRGLIAAITVLASPRWSSCCWSSPRPRRPNHTFEHGGLADNERADGTAPHPPGHRRRQPASVTVAVLNGTSTSELGPHGRAAARHRWVQGGQHRHGD